MKKISLLLILNSVFINAQLQAESIPKIKFLDEYIIESNMTYQNTTIGGLSSIDYSDGYFYIISDDGGGKRKGILGEPRYYKADIKIKNNKIENIDFVSITKLLPKGSSTQGIDPESLRIQGHNNQYFWSSEGSVKHNIEPAIYISNLKQQPQQLSQAFSLPEHFKIRKNAGPYFNAAFEGLSLSHDNKGIWVSMEGPLKQDSVEASLNHGAPVRMSYFSFSSKKIERQFTYYLDALPNEEQANKDAYRTIGVVALLQLSNNRFIVIERAYTAGLKSGGNRVKVYLVDSSQATDTKNLYMLKGEGVTVAKKELWLDLASVKEQFGSKRVTNIEGITFGPKLASGNDSLLLISDDNFSLFDKQINQVLLFEVSNL
jgi:hypothetical protein